jgi:hypothetical protein
VHEGRRGLSLSSLLQLIHKKARPQNPATLSNPRQPAPPGAVSRRLPSTALPKRPAPHKNVLTLKTRHRRRHPHLLLPQIPPISALPAGKGPASRPQQLPASPRNTPPAKIQAVRLGGRQDLPADGGNPVRQSEVQGGWGDH